MQRQLHHQNSSQHKAGSLEHTAQPSFRQLTMVERVLSGCLSWPKPLPGSLAWFFQATHLVSESLQFFSSENLLGSSVSFRLRGNHRFYFLLCKGGVEGIWSVFRTSEVILSCLPSSFPGGIFQSQRILTKQWETQNLLLLFISPLRRPCSINRSLCPSFSLAPLSPV